MKPRHYIVLLALALLVIYGLSAKLGWTLAEVEQFKAQLEYRSFPQPGR